MLAQGVDATALSIQPSMAVSVDLLTVLFRDADPQVRMTALEVYLRRVYRAQNMHTINIAEEVG